MIRKICSLSLVPVLCVSLFTACDNKVAPKKPKADAKKSLGSPDVRFVEARSKMINGQFEEAATELGAIIQEPNVRQPLQTWIKFHQGMALMLAGKQDEAQAIFGKIEDDGPFTKAGSDSQIASFFVKIAHLLRTKDPIPPTEGRDYDKWSFEGIALLAFALKDWNLEKFDDATALFRQFAEVAPEKMVDWADGPADLKKLKEMGDNFVNDYKEFDPAHKRLVASKESAVEEQVAAVEEAKAARAKMKMTSKMSATLDALIAEIGPKAMAMAAEKAKANAEDMAADEKTLGDAKTKRKELMDKFQFAEARTVMNDANLKTEQARDEQQLLVKKTSWLANFKSQLVEDLAKKGYAEPFKKKAGEAVAAGIATADEQQITLKSRATMPWSDLSLDSAYEMGKSFILPDMPPEITGFRKWHLGVFAFYAGKKKEALELLQEAAKLRPVFKDELPLFENANGPY